MELDHDLVFVDEFDALSIEPRVASSSTPAANDDEPKLLPPLNPPQDAGKQSIGQTLSGQVGKFPAKAHARKVVAELKARDGFIYLPGQVEQLYEESDMGPDFRQRRHFFYMAGADFAGCSVTYDIARDHLVLWIPYTNPRAVLWYGRTPSPKECIAAIDVDEVRYSTGLDKFLHATLRPGSTLYVLNEAQKPKLRRAEGEVHIDSRSLAPAIERARVTKTDYEVAMIRQANAVSSAAHRAVLARLRKLTNEREIEAIFRGYCIAQGAKRQAYPVIAAAGTAASTLHYIDNDQPLAGRQLVVLDAGAEWNCYASDITRTFPVSGRFSPEAAAIYNIVQRMQNECIQRVRPGVVFGVLHLHASAVAISGLSALGILHNGTAEEILQNGTIAAFFPHGLGHHVGLEVHDVSGRSRDEKEQKQQQQLWSKRGTTVTSGSTNSLRDRVAPKRVSVGAYLQRAIWAGISRHGEPSPDSLGSWVMGGQRLEKNMVVTIEPGIYFCREYIEACFLQDPRHARYINTAVLDRYWDVGGVRIEDVILVTETGYENLTTAPKGDEMLRIIREGEAYCGSGAGLG